jgi:predicted transcriptional regulator
MSIRVPYTWGMPEGTKTTIRLPDEIHDALKRIAADQDRSFNAQLVRALREWLASQPRP